MAKIIPPEPVKPLFGLLYKDRSIYEKAIQRIASQFGTIDYFSDEFPFVETTYYEPEMGANLIRRFLSLETLIFPDQLVHCKQLSNVWEEEFSVAGKRTINLDPGYIGPANLVLASAKNYSQRIYLGRGIYAEVTMLYEHGKFHELPWTYPDYSNHKDVLQQICSIYKQQRKTDV